MSSRAPRPQESAPRLPGEPQPAESRWRLADRWQLAELAGRLVEISGSRGPATLTAAFGLVREAQRCGEPVAWISLLCSSFFPPDAAQGGVALDALAVVRVVDPQAAARSAAQLLRSGAFGLVVLDLVPAGGPIRGRVKISPALQTRLLGLAQKHNAAVVLLTEKSAEAPSLGSLISVRAEARRESKAPFEVRVSVLKDKRFGPGRVYREICRGPAGLH